MRSPSATRHSATTVRAHGKNSPGYEKVTARLNTIRLRLVTDARSCVWLPIPTN